ncbi:TIGR00730 family Rossman fold protein [Acetobacteraceae bacterium]|nr:TIGR00730 family Rossman fold protein [Acetobacteraceae bacterium]
MTFKTCAVFCGSRFGNSPSFAQEAEHIGKILAQNHITLIYGGGNTGLMGAVATACLQAGGNVKGVIPYFLKEVETAHPDVADLETTNSMSSRKVKMIELSEAFIILPGGLGTFDEFFEVVTERQLNLSQKPIFLLNIENWANPLLKTLEACVKQGFAEENILNFVKIFPSAKGFEAFFKTLNKNY